MLAMELKQQGLSGERLQETLQQHEKDALRDQIDQLLLTQKGKEEALTTLRMTNRKAQDDRSRDCRYNFQFLLGFCLLF